MSKVELKPCPFCGGMAKVKVCDGSGSVFADIGTDEDYDGVIQDEMIKDAIDIIKRQKAEIERLKEEVDRLTILAHGSKIKHVGKFVPRDYEQLTIDDMEDDT